MRFNTLYKLDTTGKIRIWWCESDGDKYRVVSGIEDGKLVESKWKVAKPKNIGKINETTGEEQAELEIASLYEKQLKTYSENKDNLGEAKFFAPMLASKFDREKIKFDSEVFINPKLDGYRSVVSVNGMHSRGGERFVSSPHIHNAMSELFEIEGNSGLVFDGELYNHDYRDDFNKLQSLISTSKPTEQDLIDSLNSVQYHIYDVFDPKHPDAPYSERSAYLNYLSYEGIFPHYIKFVDTHLVSSLEEIDEYHAKFIEMGYEGSIIRLDKPYENKRTKSLIKRKDFFDSEYKVVGFEEGQGNWSGCVKRVTCELPDGRTFGAGMRGTQEYLARLLNEKDEWIGKSEATIRYPNLTPDGLPRFGVCVALYKGKRNI